MNTASGTTHPSMHRVSAVTLSVGFVLSLAVHFGVGLGASGYFASIWRSSDSFSKPIEILPEPVRPSHQRDEIRLGMQDSTTASINWLGVIEDPQAGDAPIATVEQAEFTRDPGDAPVTTAPEPTPVLIEQSPVTAIEPVQEMEAEPIKDVSAETIDAAVDQDQPESAPPEAAREQIELELDPNESAEILIEHQSETVEETSQAQEVQAEPEPEPDPDSETDSVSDPEPELETESPIGPSLVSVDPLRESDKPVEADSVNSPSEVEQSPPVPTNRPSDAGKNGVVSDRESTASIIKRSIKVDAKKLNKPIVGQGLEITTVEPKFPASVRFTQLPRNPVLMIRFDAMGRVSKVRFLTEGRRVFDTGSKMVDEPLINAVYQWRAKGKEIDALDPNDPEAFIEIPMNITFTKETKAP